jgi:hypothetical protein
MGWTKITTLRLEFKTYNGDYLVRRKKEVPKKTLLISVGR